MSKTSLGSALTLAAFLAGSAFAAPQAGDEAPGFELTGSDGKTYNLADFKDKEAVVVAWFPKAFTPGCTNECKSFRENGEALRAFAVAYFTASCDTVELNTEFAKSLDLDYPILSDPDGSVAKAYGLIEGSRKTPARKTFIIGAGGKLLYVFDQVKTSSHGEDLVAKLAELGVPKRK